MPITKQPSSLAQMLRHVHELDPPTLLKAFDDHIADTQSRQSGPIGESWWVQIFSKRPSTIRKMLRHERGMDAIVFIHICEVLELEYMDAIALWLANAPAKLIADICRADALGGPKRDRYTCDKPGRPGLYRYRFYSPHTPVR